MAGSGKTTTLLNAVGCMRGRSISLAAYNRKIANELNTKLSAMGLNQKAKAATFHSFGFQAWRRVCQNLKTDEKKTFSILDDLNVPTEYHSFVRQAVSLAKQRAIGVHCDLGDSDEWYDIVDHFDLEYELADRDGNLPPDVDSAVEAALDHSLTVLKTSIERATGVIDFDDMLYMPLIANCKYWENDVLLVDEAQDTNPVRRFNARKMLARNGRAIFVGDPHQAIYGFTGADNDALDIIKQEFNCIELPLTVTFRCPKAVVEVAQQWVHHIQAAPTAPDGHYGHEQYDEFLKRQLGVGGLLPTDAMLCRNTKPLVEVAYALIQRNIPCHVEGKEIGRGLLKLINRWKVRGLHALVDKLEEFREREVVKLLAAKREASAETLNDKIDTILVIMEGLGQNATVDDLRNRIMSMFEDTPDGFPAQNFTLSTVHKSKGLEWERVFLLGREKFMPSRFARQDWQMAQEINLMYVAVTRSMDTLIEVSAPPK